MFKRKTVNAQMDIELMSKNKMDKPSWISVDAVTARLPTGEEFYFDFEDMNGNSEIQSDGKCLISFSKSGFDEEYFKACNDDKIVKAGIDWSRVSEWEFIEVYVVGDSTDGHEDIHTDDFIVSSLSFTTSYSNKADIRYLSPKQLDQLNKNISFDDKK